MEKIITTNDVLDALIIGGGPAGATIGILLAEAGWTVGIVEKKMFPRRKVCGEFMSATNLSLLQKLGVADFYLNSCGPEIKQVGLYVAEEMLTTKMPNANHSQSKWGRALGREHLDMVLLHRASDVGAKIWQPFNVERLHKDRLFTCTINNNNKVEHISSQIVIMANGSWEGKIDESHNKTHLPSDLLAFKAHFRNANLSKDLMPLIAFTGGYGGMVHSDNGRVSLSFCMRRDVLQGVRKQYGGIPAGEAALHYIKSKCFGVDEVLRSSLREGNWLACGPIQPGIRPRYKEGIFFVGNSAGEAHPIIAEGISMAMQSAWLLSQILTQNPKNRITEDYLASLGKEYSTQWHRHFANRIYVAAILSQVAMRPLSQSIMLHLIKKFPKLLTFGAKLSGKIQQVVPEQ